LGKRWLLTAFYTTVLFLQIASDTCLSQVEGEMLDLSPEIPALPFSVQDWGRTSYLEALERQRLEVTKRKAEAVSDQLIFTEHNPVFTMGLRKGASANLVWSAEVCAAKGIEVVQTNRGGDITYHGPGQIVAYPIFSLRKQPDLHRYLRNLETVVINTLTQFNIPSDRRDGKTGIWVEDRKLCAMGVAVRSWISYHGLALNVNTDLSPFAGIIPCGITDGTVGSMAGELGHAVSISKVKRALTVEFARVFADAPEHG